MSVLYLVFEDLDDATQVKIHKSTCGHTKRPKETTTTRWHGPYDLKEATDKAKTIAKTKGWDYAKCCMPLH
jgi:hypothetical protein